ncbi:MAG: DUF4338 domain-containing protein [Boseongicola sp. SB0675_bin_26]|nr:DUF4338 domain-containing protein [Boseongicola sp. SB0675_bin_26]
MAGAAGFLTGVQRVPVRDRWIGWDDAGRGGHLRHPICLSRFLVRSNVRCPHLAGQALGRTLQDCRTTSRRATSAGRSSWTAGSMVCINAHSRGWPTSGSWESLGVEVETTGPCGADESRRRFR